MDQFWHQHGETVVGLVFSIPIAFVVGVLVTRDDAHLKVLRPAH